MTKVVYCPLETETKCGYWVAFGGHLIPFVKGLQEHIRKGHPSLSAGDTRTKGGLIDRWIGDHLVDAVGQEVINARTNR
ncbi:hypothetical protein LCGC14_2414030 [marine sediment metagenome]|uniref:DUF1059 domain-containing protein n=1 Tax=marine sediment metagenome TaxID=412755 RepID=A0A0F9CDT2_9ZZZZ